MSESSSATMTMSTMSSLDRLARKTALNLLGRIQSGGFVIKEQGTLIGHFGRVNDPLQAEIDVLKPQFYRRLLLGGSIAAGELFIDEAWQTPDLTKVIQVFARNLAALDAFEARFSWILAPLQRFQHWRRKNSKQQAKENISAHYDLGNDLYQAFLDTRLQYSSAVYPRPDASLAEAQTHKLRRLCESIELTASDHLVEIGTGWGGLALFAATEYGCRVTTTTISEEQYRHTEALIKQHGLEDKITLLKQDYRDLQGQFDKLISVEMIEAVGKHYLPTFFATCSRLLKPEGKMALQAITIADQRMRSYAHSVDFIQKHIFPGGFLPSLTMMGQLFTKHTDMVVREVHDIGFDYAQTLYHWRQQFNHAHPSLKAAGYDDRFGRLWNFYLAYCEGGFRERTVSAVQLVASKPLCR